MCPDVSAEEVVHALRRIRPSVYRLEQGDGGTTLALVIDVSAAGRRNAAEKIVTALADSNLEVAAEDPVEALATERRSLAVRRAR